MITQFMRFACLLMVLLLANSAYTSSLDSGSAELPEHQISNLMLDLSDYKLETLWSALPASYQSDVVQLINSSAEVLDADVYNQFFGLQARLAKTLAAKKRLLARYWQTQPKRKRRSFLKKFFGPNVGTDPNYEQVIDLFTKVLFRLANSELSEYSNLQNFQMDKFIRKDFVKIMKVIAKVHPYLHDNMLSLRQVSVSPHKVYSPTHIGLVINGPSQERSVVHFVNVESRWIPRKMQVLWPVLKNYLEAAIHKAKNNRFETNMKLRVFLLSGETLVKVLAKSKTVEDIEMFFTVLGKGKAVVL